MVGNTFFHWLNLFDIVPSYNIPQQWRGFQQGDKGLKAFIRVSYLIEDIYMKFINKNDKKLITIILTVIIFGWLAYLTFEIYRIDNNLNSYIESVIKENLKKAE